MVNLKFSILITVNAKNCGISLEVFGEDLQEGKNRAFTFYIPATGIDPLTSVLQYCPTEQFGVVPLES